MTRPRATAPVLARAAYARRTRRVAAASRLRDDSRELLAAEAVSWAEGHLFERRSVVREHELWRHALEVARGEFDLGRRAQKGNCVASVSAQATTRSRIAMCSRVNGRSCKPRATELARTRHCRRGSLEPTITDAGTSDRVGRHSEIADFITLFRGGAGTGKSFVLRRRAESNRSRRQRIRRSRTATPASHRP